MSNGVGDPTGVWSKRKIGPELEKQIMRLAADGWSCGRIAEWCAKERGTKLAKNAIYQLLARTKAFRKDVANAVVAETLRTTLHADLERLEEIRQNVAARSEGCESDRDYVQLARLEVDIIERRMKFAGVSGAEDRVEVDPATLARMASEVLAGAGATK